MFNRDLSRNLLMALSLLITVTVNFALHNDNHSSNMENELWVKWGKDLWPQFAAFCCDWADAEGYSVCQYSVVTGVIKVSHSLDVLALRCFTNIHICMNTVSGLPAGLKLGQSSCFSWLPRRWLTRGGSSYKTSGCPWPVRELGQSRTASSAALFEKGGFWFVS